MTNRNETLRSGKDRAFHQNDKTPPAEQHAAGGDTCIDTEEEREPRFEVASNRGFIWQREKDSNPHIQSQSLLCYPYTIPLELVDC